VARRQAGPKGGIRGVFSHGKVRSHVIDKDLANRINRLISVLLHGPFMLNATVLRYPNRTLSKIMVERGVPGRKCHWRFRRPEGRLLPTATALPIVSIACSIPLLRLAAAVSVYAASSW